MNELFWVFLFFSIGSVAVVVILTMTILLLMKQVRELEDELEANLPPF